MGRAAAALVLFFLLASAVQAQTVTIAGGDRVSIGDAAYRFLGVEAPDPRQVCNDGYPAGREAIKALQRLMQGRRIACDVRGRDPSGRSLATWTDGLPTRSYMSRKGTVPVHLNHAQEAAHFTPSEPIPPC